jgi:hypothetical protein
MKGMVLLSLLWIAAILFIPSITVTAQTQSWCGIQTLYFQHNASTSPVGYEELINYPSGNTEVDEQITVTNTGGPVLIDNYIMPEESLTTTTMLDRGLRVYRYYSYVSSATGITQLNFTAFKRFANGTEINFYTAMSGDIDGLTVSEYTFNYVSQLPVKINSTDRLGIRVTANTSHSSPIVIHWVYQGSLHTSNFESGYFECSEIPTVRVIPNSPVNNIPVPVWIPLLAIAIAAGICYLALRKH